MTDEPLLLVTDALAAGAVNVPLMDRWNAMDAERKRRAMLFLRGVAIRQPEVTS
jgi:hypothetical protein